MCNGQTKGSEIQSPRRPGNLQPVESSIRVEDEPERPASPWYCTDDFRALLSTARTIGGFCLLVGVITYCAVHDGPLAPEMMKLAGVGAALVLLTQCMALATERRKSKR